MDYESMAKDPVKLENYWTKLAGNVLLGKKIVHVKYMSQEEAEEFGWFNRPVAFKLDDGTWVIAQSDDEGNDGGVLHYTHKDEEKYQDWCMPVLR
tara:strand:- start:972 stop:1256 length:285 start_codon:yes stop_codon:yes gene_type:complete